MAAVGSVLSKFEAKEMASNGLQATAHVLLACDFRQANSPAQAIEPGIIADISTVIMRREATFIDTMYSLLS